MSYLRRTKGLLGFTLIELLVVIAIIAILAAILFPVFAQAREAARKTTCQSNLKQFGSAFAMYRSDYDGRFPAGGWYGNLGGNPDMDRSLDWHLSLFPYIKNTGVYLCPSSTDIHDLPHGPADWNRTSSDYLYNNQLAANRTPLTEAAVAAPADCIQLIEGHSDWGRGPCITPFSNGQMTNPPASFCHEYTTFGRNSSLVTGGLWATDRKLWDLPRHQGGANVAFVDGHVKFYKQLDAVGAQDSVNKMEAQLPYRRHMNPTQSTINDPNDRWSAHFN
jgi:prepilin-type processing-associated H-X9-DG protein/prepilin-type N-terminal cleavage/methylation domain-containing protein